MIKNLFDRVRHAVVCSLVKPTIKEKIARDWVRSSYYDLVEDKMELFWDKDSSFFRLFQNLDTNVLVELACGHGRHSQHVLENFSVERLFLVDINVSNIDFCKKRFKEKNNVTYISNNGNDLLGIEKNSVTGVFCYDAMVHFEYDDVASYLLEIQRILVEGGKALLHHSNNDKQPGNIYSDNTSWRNFMSSNLFKHMACRAGLDVLEQVVFDWGEAKDLDCLTLVSKS